MLVGEVRNAAGRLGQVLRAARGPVERPVGDDEGGSAQLGALGSIGRRAEGGDDGAEAAMGEAGDQVHGVAPDAAYRVGGEEDRKAIGSASGLRWGSAPRPASLK